MRDGSEDPEWTPPGPEGYLPGAPGGAGTGDPLAQWAPAAAPSDGWGGSAPLATPAASGGRLWRGLRLVGIGFRVVRDEPGLTAVPVVAFVAELVVLGLVALAFSPVWSSSGSTQASAPQWVAVAVGALAVVFVSVLAQATLVARVTARFHGERVTNTQAFRAALTRSPHLLAWAFIDGVVLSIVRGIGRQGGIVGMVFGSLLRAGWQLASFFVVPVILFEDLGALAAVKRSVHLCRSRWGENIVGNSAIAVVGVVAVLLWAVVSFLAGHLFLPLGAVAGPVGMAVIILVLTVASAAFRAALYWFAVTGQSPGGYPPGDLEAAYRPRRSRLSTS